MQSTRPYNAVVFSGVRLAHGSRIVLDNVDLAIRENEFVGVLGPNGSGKTTLMRAILGLITAERGTITVLGEPVTRGNARVGYVPQLHGAMVSARLRGWDVVASAVRGEHLGLPLLSPHDRVQIDRALALVGAEGLARRPVSQLSGGERQRLLLAQALIGEPRLLLLDEPLASLDPHYADEVVQLVRNIQTELGISVLFSAHELNPLLPAMDRVLYLGNRQATIGSIDDVINGPVLSRLYGSQIDVVKVNGSVFVMSGRHHAEEHHSGHHPHNA